QDKKKEIRRLYITLGFLLGILLVMTAYLSIPLITGDTVILATTPVDPFGPLRGQYISINYEISTIPAIDGAKEGEKVYVTLSEDEQGISRYSSSSLKKPEGLYIAGRIQTISHNDMTVRYGIEQYFFERNADFQLGNLTVEARVAKSGQARITRLLVTGKPAEIVYEKPGVKT
ncbi:MAG: GDYXXLXY domain-containing protein, partial [Candidatus Woesearchaeota archaeon]